LIENPEAQELLESGFRVVTGGAPCRITWWRFWSGFVKNPRNYVHQFDYCAWYWKKELQLFTEVELAYEVSESNSRDYWLQMEKQRQLLWLQDILNIRSEKDTLYVCWEHWTPVSGSQTQLSKWWNYYGIILVSVDCGITRIKAPYAFITNNLISAHLDYHGSRDEYFMPK